MYPACRGQDVALLTNEITGCRGWLETFCRALGTGIKWRSDANVRNATREDFALAADHGLTEVTLGIEALDDELLRTCNKGHAVADAFRVFHWLQALGIRYRFALRQRIGETPEQLDRQIDVLKRMRTEGLRPDGVTIGPMDCWPGNTRWIGTEPHGSKRYPRFVRTLGPDAEILLAKWREILGIVNQVATPIVAAASQQSP